MAETETIHVLGEGGGIHAMDLPLPEPIAERLRKGMLRRVNADGTPYTEPDPEDGEDGGKTVLVPEPGQQLQGPPLTQPGKDASKTDWVGWAVVRGADPEVADGMTKADLIEKYGT
jgi:hypothetical protein